jgi:hypothetical protein
MALMDDIEHVIREIGRVLRPSGQFAAIVDSTFLPEEINDIFMRIFKPIASAALPSMRFGDRCTGSEASWRELLDGSFEHIVFNHIDVPLSSTPGELWTALVDTDDIDRLNQDARLRVKLPPPSTPSAACRTRTAWSRQAGDCARRARAGRTAPRP